MPHVDIKVRCDELVPLLVDAEILAIFAWTKALQALLCCFGEPHIVEALIVQVADNGIRIIGARMAEIDTLVSGNDGDEAAGVASVERLGVEVLVHPIVFIVVDDGKTIPREVRLRPMDLLDDVIFDACMVVRLVFHDSSEFHIVAAELAQETCGFIDFVGIRAADDEVDAEDAVLVFRLCEIRNVLRDGVERAVRQAAQATIRFFHRRIKRDTYPFRCTKSLGAISRKQLAVADKRQLDSLLTGKIRRLHDLRITERLAATGERDGLHAHVPHVLQDFLEFRPWDAVAMVDFVAVLRLLRRPARAIRAVGAMMIANVRRLQADVKWRPLLAPRQSIEII